MRNTTPWEELQELAAMNRVKGHYKDNPRNMPEVQPEYTELAKRRQYLYAPTSPQGRHHIPVGLHIGLPSCFRCGKSSGYFRSRLSLAVGPRWRYFLVADCSRTKPEYRIPTTRPPSTPPRCRVAQR